MNGVHTLVVAGKIKRGRESNYERWVSKLVTTLHDTPGYNGMTAISSSDPQGSVGTLLIRFLSAESLSQWEDSPVPHSLIEEGDQFSASDLPCRSGSRGLFLDAGKVGGSVSLENVLVNNSNDLPAI